MKKIEKSSRLKNVHYEVRGELERQAFEMERLGEKILKLNIGNPPCFGLLSPDTVTDQVAEQRYLSQAYSSPEGLDRARDAILRYDIGKGITKTDVNHIFTGNGVSELISMTMDALLNAGDEVLIPSPDYPLWTAAVTMSGGKAVHYICDEEIGWYPDLNDIEKKISAKTRGIVIINPNNPTGVNYPVEILSGITDIARRHGLIIFSDEIYDRLLLSEGTGTSIASLSDDVLCLTYNGLSKSHMLCGYRIGWVTISGNLDMADDYMEGLEMLASMRLCSNVPGQSLIDAALSGNMRAEEYFKEGGRVRLQRDTVYEMLNAIPGVSAVKPDAAFYIFPKIDTGIIPIDDDRKFALDLLKEKKILIVPGSGFNYPRPDHFRIVYLPPADVLKTAMGDIADFISSR